MTNTEILIGLLSAAASALGFAIMFRVRKKHLLAMAIGGALAYAVYLLVKEYTGGEFFPNLAAAILTAFFAEGCAHGLRAPAQIYLIPILVPLFPGGGLYYAMYYLLAKNYGRFVEYLLITLETALGLSGGIIVGLAIATAFVALLRALRAKKRKNTETKG